MAKPPEPLANEIGIQHERRRVYGASEYVPSEPSSSTPRPGARLRRALPLLPLLIAAFALAKGVRAYQHSRDEQRPPRGPVEVPPELSHDGRLEHVHFPIAGGFDVHGWYVPSRNGAALLFVHGQPGTRRDLLPEAEAMISAGYGALLLDMPGHGESSGYPVWGEAACNATVGGVDFLAHRADVNPRAIGAFGFSMGSSVVARVATRERRIAAVVLTGVFTGADEQIVYEYRRLGPVTWWPALQGAKHEGLEFEWLRTEQFIAALAPTPALFVAGTADSVVPLYMTQKVFDRAGEPKELLVVPGSNHGAYAATMGAPYFARVRAFFDRYLGGAFRVGGSGGAP